MSHSDVIFRAHDFAKKAHGTQRYGEHPYSVHLNGVYVMVAGTMGFLDADTGVAAILHDVLEDTSVTREEIEREFGPNVLALVSAVTLGEGKNRREKYAEAYPRILAAGVSAVAIKVADRCSNVSHCWKTMNSKLFMYYREYPDFRKVLFSDEERFVIAWRELDKMMGWRPLEKR